MNYFINCKIIYHMMFYLCLAQFYSAKNLLENVDIYCPFGVRRCSTATLQSGSLAPSNSKGTICGANRTGVISGAAGVTLAEMLIRLARAYTPRVVPEPTPWLPQSARFDKCARETPRLSWLDITESWWLNDSWTGYVGVKFPRGSLEPLRVLEGLSKGVSPLWH